MDRREGGMASNEELVKDLEHVEVSMCLCCWGGGGSGMSIKYKNKYYLMLSSS